VPDFDPCFIQIDENPNCEAIAGLVFQPRTDFRAVSHVRLEHDGPAAWYEVTGLGERGRPSPALAAVIDDSGEGSGYLVVGGSWGLRFQDPQLQAGWSVEDRKQWGLPLLLLAGNAADLRFV
jgi:hypothetical protein